MFTMTAMYGTDDNSTNRPNSCSADLQSDRREVNGEG